VDTWELLRRSRAIHTGDNHNSPRTPAPASIHPLRGRGPAACSGLLVLRAAAFRLSSPSSLSSSLYPVSSLRVPYLASPPWLPRASCRAERGLFRNCFRPFLLLLRLRLPACLPLPRVLYRNPPFPLFPVLYPPPLPAPSAALPSRLIVWLSQPARSVSISRYPVHLPPVHFLLPPLFLSFARWPREIHETKFMITTSKQRAARHGGYLPRCPLYIPFASPSHLPPLLADPNRSSAAPQLLLRPISPAFRHSSSPCSPRLLPPSPSFHHSSSTLSVRKGRRLFERASLPRDWLAFSDRCVRRVEQDTRHARFPPPPPPPPGRDNCLRLCLVVCRSPQPR